MKAVVIRGGGISGLAAAIGLAREGRRVKVLERPGYPEKMKHAGFRTLENFTRDEDVCGLLDDLGIRRDLFLMPLHQAVLFNHKRLPFVVSSGKPFVYLIRRGSEPGSLDRALFERARALDVEFSTGDVPPDILATGPAQADGIALERHFHSDQAFRIWAYFDALHAPGAYAYLFTHGGLGTFGTAITRDFGNLKKHAAFCWEAFQSLESFPVEGMEERGSWMNFYLPESYEEKGVKFAGEAAGLQDFLFGLGMRMGMESGLLAARAILKGEDYTSLVRARFERFLKRGVAHRFLYERLGNASLTRALNALSRGDYRERLRTASAGGALDPILLPFVKFLCKNRSACRHPLRPHFCRRLSKTTGTAGS